jgi:hypothetical protein
MLCPYEADDVTTRQSYGHGQDLAPKLPEATLWGIAIKEELHITDFLKARHLFHFCKEVAHINVL